MPIFDFLWYDENEEHVAEHGVTKEEFEEVAQWGQRREVSRQSGHPIVFGRSTGKYIACVVEELDELLILPVTAYEVGE